MTKNSFSNLPLSKPMLENLNDLAYTQMTPIQEKSLPYVLQGKDIIAKAKTGSGKTAAFGLGLIHALAPRKFQIQSAVITPTRELADQVAAELRRLARYQDNIKIITLVGGEPLFPQRRAMEKGVHIVVGTPGRIMDHITKGTIQFDALKTLVLDEADRMLDMGFFDDIAAIVKYLPQKRQTLLFSATFPPEILELSKDLQNEPTVIEVETTENQTRIEEHFYEVTSYDKTEALESLISLHKISSAIIFCNMKVTCDEVAQKLYESGYDALALHGDMEQQDRNEVLTLFSQGSANFLVATDVAARGLDIKDLPAIINYDISRQAEVHTHRIGRTGRMEKEGLALTLFSAHEKKFIQEIETTAKKSIQIETLDRIEADPDFSKKAAFGTIKIFGGKKNKLRPGDIVGAFIGELGLKADQIGTITIQDKYSYVALRKNIFETTGHKDDRIKIKAKQFRYMKLI